MISASMSSSCSGLRTSTPSAPISRSVSRCSLKSPWRPRTPTRAVLVGALPAADGKAFAGGDGLERDAAHRLAETARDLGDELRVLEVGRGLDDRFGESRGVARLVDPGADEVPFRPELHGQCGIRGCRDTSGAEEDDRKALILRDLPHQLDRNAVLLGLRIEAGVLQVGERADRGGDRAQVRHGLDDVARTGLALAADHRRAFVDAAERLTEVARAADEWDLEVV